MEPFICVSLVNGEPVHQGSTKQQFGLPVLSEAGRCGMFANWELRDGRLTAEVDPLGMYSLFYYSTPDAVLISASIDTLIGLGADRTLDDQAITVFHMLGWYLDEDTPFKFIKVLPPGGRLVWNRGALTVTGGRPEFGRESTSRPAAIEQYEKLFSNAVASCADRSFAMPLSGGRDSRHIFLELMDQGVRPEYCVTINPIPSGTIPDLECARQLSSMMSVKHESVPPSQSAFRAVVTTIRLTSYCTDEHAHMLALAHHLESAGLDLMDGIGGDVLSRNKGFTDPELSSFLTAGQYEQAIAKLAGRFDRITGTTIEQRANGLIKLDVRSARDRIFSSFDKVRNTADPYTQFLFWSRTRREISLSPRMLRWAPRAPRYVHISTLAWLHFAQACLFR